MLQYRRKHVPVRGKYYGGIIMAYVIGSDCVSCGACADGCAVGAIVEGADTYVITDECVSCGACIDTCPVGAISEE